jgi:putative Mg2+ transporter-C (MgtC) family protein
MDLIWQELIGDLGDTHRLVRVVVRSVLAVILGGVIGLERAREGKAAGIRTHMLVALGAAILTMIPQEFQHSSDAMSRVIQGIAAGIGFLGAGTIIKAGDEKLIRGLTTAASIWLTAALGIAAGAGWFWPALCGVALGWVILSHLHRLDDWAHGKDER